MNTQELCLAIGDVSLARGNRSVEELRVMIERASLIASDQGFLEMYVKGASLIKLKISAHRLS